MDLNVRTEPTSGYENMTVAQVEQAVAALRGTLGLTEPTAAAQQPPAPMQQAPTQPTAAPPPAPAAAHPQAESEVEAAKRGRTEERARIKGILALPEAKDRHTAALALALETDIPVAAAGPALAKFPAETAQQGKGGYLRAAIDANGGTPKVSHMTQSDGQPRASSLVSGAKEMAVKMRPPSKMQIPTSRQ